MSEQSAAHMHGTILKADEDQRLVWGWASVIEEDGRAVVDSQGDVIGVQDLMDAAHGFMIDTRKGGIMHATRDGSAIRIGEVVESMILTKDRQDALGIDLGRIGWLIAMKVHDGDVWKAIRGGGLRAFSIGGRGVRVPLREG